MWHSYDSRVNFAFWAVLIVVGAGVFGGTRAFVLAIMYCIFALIAFALFSLLNVIVLQIRKRKAKIITLQTTTQPEIISIPQKSERELLKAELMDIPAYARKQMGIAYPISSFNSKDCNGLIKL